MPTLIQTFRHLQRYQQIGRILTRYGFGFVLTQLGIPGRAPGFFGRITLRRGSAPDVQRASQAERLRLAIEELGPTFIKLGQILSTRGDLLPPEFVGELEKLQDTVPPTPFALIREQVEKELRHPLDQLFPTFDEVPVASASLGQVHLATLRRAEEPAAGMAAAPSPLPAGQSTGNAEDTLTGAEALGVAVKVLRPGIEKVIETDLDILLELAALAEKRTEWGAYYGVLSLAQEFAHVLRSELNYEQEGHNMDLFRQNSSGEDYVRVPRVYWQTTTRRVLTMERIEGIKITNVAALQAAGVDCPAVARGNIRILLKAVLNDGFFHADPHPGNFHVMPGPGRAPGFHDVIGMMDFGIMGHLDQIERLGLVRLFVSLFTGETERVVDALGELGIATRAADKRKLVRDFDLLRMRYYGLDLVKIRARSFFEELMQVALDNRLKMPSNLVLVFKSIAMLEGISLQLDPDLNVFTEVEPYVRDAILELQSPVTRARELLAQMQEAMGVTMMLPRQLRRMLEQIEDGEGNLSLTMKGLEEPTRRVTRAANRLALAILAVAFVLGPALIIPHLQDLFPQWQTAAATLIVSGFATSLLITIALVLSILRSGRA